jgi:ParB-like chromosome segregation protein Spo0J
MPALTPKRQIRQIADSIRKFGFTNQVLMSDDDEIIAGHGRVAAAKLIGMPGVPALRLSHLDAAQRRAYFIADNKLPLNAGRRWSIWTSMWRSPASPPPRSRSLSIRRGRPPQAGSMSKTAPAGPTLVLP